MPAMDKTFLRKTLLLSAAALSAALAPLRAAAQDAPFDAKTAAEFISQNPDFKKCAAGFARRADSLYADSKFPEASAALFASEFF